MEKIVPEEIERYAAEHSAAESELFRDLAQTTQRETAAPQMQVGHLEGAFLRMLIRMSKAKMVLEIGTFTGYSSLAMAEGLPEDGRLITCDINPDTTAVAKRFWAQSPHGAKIELRLGPAADTIAGLNETFDFVFIDADKENYHVYWDACLPKVRQGGIIAADNVLWSGRVLNPKEASDKAIAAFNAKVAADTRVEAVITTVRDGVTLAYKL